MLHLHSRYRREIDPPIQRLLHLYNDRIKSDRLGFDQFEPVAAFATLGFALVEPHPTDGRCVLLAQQPMTRKSATDGTRLGLAAVPATLLYTFISYGSSRPD